MKTALVALLILLFVYALVGLSAWHANRMFGRTIDREAARAIEARQLSRGPTRPRPRLRDLTRRDLRWLIVLVAVFFLVPYGAMVAGITLISRKGAIQFVGYGLGVVGLATLLLRARLATWAERIMKQRGVMGG